MLAGSAQTRKALSDTRSVSWALAGAAPIVVRPITAARTPLVSRARMVVLPFRPLRTGPPSGAAAGRMFPEPCPRPGRSVTWRVFTLWYAVTPAGAVENVGGGTPARSAPLVLHLRRSGGMTPPAGVITSLSALRLSSRAD